MSYFEEIGPLLCLFPEKYTQRYPWAASERSQQPYLMVIQLLKTCPFDILVFQFQCNTYLILILPSASADASADKSAAKYSEMSAI